MEITTSGLTEILKNTKEINSFLQKNESYITNPTLQEYLKKLLLLKGLKRQDVIKNAQLDSNYINQLFSGIKTNPGRNQTLSLAFGFGLNNEETARLLKMMDKYSHTKPKIKNTIKLLNINLYNSFINDK